MIAYILKKLSESILVARGFKPDYHTLCLNLRMIIILLTQIFTLQNCYAHLMYGHVHFSLSRVRQRGHRRVEGGGEGGGVTPTFTTYYITYAVIFLTLVQSPFSN